MFIGKQSTVDMATPLVSIERFSTKSRLLRVYAWVLRFVSHLKTIVSKKAPKLCPLGGKELRCAENVVIREVQRECFAKEIEFI